MSMRGVQAKTIAEAGFPVHFVEARVAGHDKAIGLVEETESSAEVEAIVEVELDADALIQGKVLVGGVLGERLLRVCCHACLDGVVGLDASLVEPDEASADGQDPDAGNGFIRLRQPVAPDVGFAGLAQDDGGQKLRGIVHISADNPAPRMAVVFDAADVEIAIPGVGEKVNVAEGVQAFEDDLAVDRTARGLLRWGDDCRSETRDPDHPGGNASKVIGNAGEVISSPSGSGVMGSKLLCCMPPSTRNAV